MIDGKTFNFFFSYYKSFIDLTIKTIKIDFPYLRFYKSSLVILERNLAKYLYGPNLTRRDQHKLTQVITYLKENNNY